MQAGSAQRAVTSLPPSCRLVPVRPSLVPTDARKPWVPASYPKPTDTSADSSDKVKYRNTEVWEVSWKSPRTQLNA